MFTRSKKDKLRLKAIERYDKRFQSQIALRQKWGLRLKKDFYERETKTLFMETIVLLILGIAFICMYFYLLLPGIK